MLEALVIAGIVAAPLGSAALFLPPAPTRQARNAAGAWPAIRRFVLAVAGTALLALAAGAVLRLIHATTDNLIAGVAGLAAVSAAWLPVTRRWSARAHLCWASSTFLFVAYLTFTIQWTFDSGLGPAGTAGGVLLWLLEVLAALLSSAYLWEICDALGTENWRRRLVPAAPGKSRIPRMCPHLPGRG